MTTFYLDPIGGNDASAGTSFATRWQSITSGATAARIAPGDTIRVIQSANATSMAQNATWTDGSRTVTLASAVTAAITPATASWTTVTNTTSTTSTNRKLGSTSSSLTVSNTFTTGKSHYTLTSQADYSAYQQITFWINQTGGTLASGDGEITLKLCSDTAGATAVNTFNIPRIRALNQWQAFTIDNGAALGSSIQSIALYVNNDRASQTFLINNIQAVKAASSADSLSLTSLIGKNSGNEGWHAIDSISGTSVILATAGTNYNLSAPGTPPGYSGVTESVTTYKRELISLPSSMVATSATGGPWGAVQDTGSSGSPITFSGGWDSTAMSSQVGDTYISGVNGIGCGLYVNALTYINFERINPFKFGYGVFIEGTASNVAMSAKDVSFNAFVNLYLQNAATAQQGPNTCAFTVTNVNSAGNSDGASINLYRSVKAITFDIVNCNSSWNYGIQLAGDAAYNAPLGISRIKATITNLNRNGAWGFWGDNLDGGDMRFQNVRKNASDQMLLLDNTPGVNNTMFTIGNSIVGVSVNDYGFGSFGGHNNTLDLRGATISGLSLSGVYVMSGSAKVYGGNFANNTVADFEVGAGGTIIVANAAVNSTTKYLVDEAGTASITFDKYNTTTGDHRTYFNHGTIMSNAVVRHTAAGISWAISPTSTVHVTSDFPMVLPLGAIAVANGTAVTATLWVNRTNTGLTTKLVAKGGQIAGVATDVANSAVGSANAWEQLSVTFTPAEDGVIELEAQVYGGTTYTAFVDDLSVTQI